MLTKTIPIHPDLKHYGAFIGLDWAQGEHVLALRSACGSHTRLERLANKPAALRA